MRHLSILFLVLHAVWYSNQAPRSRIGEKQKKSGYIDGNFIIGALLPVHERPLLNGSEDPLACGKIRERYGIQRVEAAFYAIDSINNDSSILPNITLGINIKDECWSSSVALHQTIKLIEEPTLDYERSRKECKLANDEDDSPLIGIIGPGSSTTTITVQNLLKLFEIPQIGYSASSADLTDKKHYPYFLRVIPSDGCQAYLMLKLLKKFNWTYISIVYTETNYGQSGANVLRNIAPLFDICIARVVGIESSDEDYIHAYAIDQLLEDDKAKVVLCFCEGITVEGLLRNIKRRNLTNTFQFIGSDGWSSRNTVVEQYKAEAQGSITIGIKSSPLKEFDDYYFQKTPFNNERNPWFEEFWEYRFDCTMNSTINSGLPRCTGEEDLRIDHEQDSRIPSVIKSIYLLAYGLHHMQADVCKNQTGPCDNLYPFNSTKFFNYLLASNFSYHDEQVFFDPYGDLWDIKYDIFNYQQFSNGSYGYVLVGNYNGNYEELEDSTFDNDFFTKLNLYSKMQFPGDTIKPMKSVCSEPCPPGEVQLGRSDIQQNLCCWSCVRCRSGEIPINKTTCEHCATGYWPNDNQTACLKVPLDHPEWTDIQSLISLVFSILGILLTSITAIIFVKYRETPVVKSSTRELCYMMLVGMISAHSLTFAVITKPTWFTCTVVRTLAPISFTIIYAALLVKTNRIARILAISKKKFPNLNLRFMSLRAQIVITSIMIAVETIICIVLLIEEPPIPYEGFSFKGRLPYAILACPLSPKAIFVPFSFVALFIVMCTLYAIKTRNLPDNFNEAKFIGFSMYVTCITWIAFGLVYYGSDFQVLTTCICASTNALVILVFLFFPKLYIIIWVPEKNTRANFTTSKGIRCIIGREDSSQEMNKRKLLETDFKHIANFNTPRKSVSESGPNSSKRKSSEVSLKF